jgi:hypothetical protein
MIASTAIRVLPNARSSHFLRPRITLVGPGFKPARLCRLRVGFAGVNSSLISKRPVNPASTAPRLQPREFASTVKDSSDERFLVWHLAVICSAVILAALCRREHHSPSQTHRFSSTVVAVICRFRTTSSKRARGRPLFPSRPTPRGVLVINALS